MSKANKYKKEEARIALQLGYGDEIARQIEDATTQRERERLLTMARHEAIRRERW